MGRRDSNARPLAPEASPGRRQSLTAVRTTLRGLAYRWQAVGSEGIPRPGHVRRACRLCGLRRPSLLPCQRLTGATAALSTAVWAWVSDCCADTFVLSFGAYLILMRR